MFKLVIMMNPIPILASIGGLVALLQLKNLSSAIWFYFLRPTTWQIYLRGPAPYALITGATDGIGKGVAKDLYRKGFNLILHGRNEAKMNKVIEELKALGGKARENGDIRVFLADVKEDVHDFEAIAEKYVGLNITIVVNNVGGITPMDATFDMWTEKEHTGIIRWNVLFPTFLTRALLPSLRKTARDHPVLVVFVGSIAGVVDMPRISIYSASKSFLSRLSGGLHADERFHGGNSNLSFMYLQVGEVNSGTMTAPVNWFTPAADEFCEDSGPFIRFRETYRNTLPRACDTFATYLLPPGEFGETFYQ